MDERKQKGKGAASAASVANCTADYQHACDANDGEPCLACSEWLAESEREARWAWDAASPLERDPARYAREMRDAGRRP